MKPLSEWIQFYSQVKFVKQQKEIIRKWLFLWIVDMLHDLFLDKKKGVYHNLEETNFLKFLSWQKMYNSIFLNWNEDLNKILFNTQLKKPPFKLSRLFFNSFQIAQRTFETFEQKWIISILKTFFVIFYSQKIKTNELILMKVLIFLHSEEFKLPETKCYNCG